MRLYALICAISYEHFADHICGRKYGTFMPIICLAGIVLAARRSRGPSTSAHLIFPSPLLMSSRRRKGKVTSVPEPPKQVPSPQDMPNAYSSHEARGTSSSMDTVRIQPRTPRLQHDTEEVELSLLGEDERRQAAFGVPENGSARASRPKRPMSTKDKRSMGLLCILCKFTCHRHQNVTNSP